MQDKRKALRHAVAESVEIETMPCPVGCPPSDKFVLKSHDYLHRIAGEYRVVRCQTCGLMRTDPRPTAKTIGIYYPDQYGPYRQAQIERQSNRAPSYWPWRRLIKKAVDFHTDTIPSLSPGRLLEIGSASGWFMHKMAQKGWQVEGIERSADAAASARSLGYSVFAGPIEDAPDPAKSYDLMVGWMVLEHLHDPVAMLRKLHGWGRTNSYLAVSVPNLNSLDFWLFKERWYALQLPTHLFHFTIETLRTVLAQSGWQITKVFHQRVLNNYLASLGYWLQEKTKWHRMGRILSEYPDNAAYGSYLLYPAAFLLSKAGQTGRMTVWAKRME